MRILERIHRIAGVVFLLVFVMTGKYMDIYLGHLHGMADAPRTLYRSGHIYLLMGALLNLSVAFDSTERATRGGNATRVVGSLLLLAAPILFTYGFFFQTPGSVERHAIRQGIYACLAGVLLHALVRAV